MAALPASLSALFIAILNWVLIKKYTAFQGEFNIYKYVTFCTNGFCTEMIRREENKRTEGNDISVTYG